TGRKRGQQIFKKIQAPGQPSNIFIGGRRKRIAVVLLDQIAKRSTEYFVGFVLAPDPTVVSPRSQSRKTGTQGRAGQAAVEMRDGCFQYLLTIGDRKTVFGPGLDLGVSVLNCATYNGVSEDAILPILGCTFQSLCEFARNRYVLGNDV